MFRLSERRMLTNHQAHAASGHLKRGWLVQGGTDVQVYLLLSHNQMLNSHIGLRTAVLAWRIFRSTSANWRIFSSVAHKLNCSF